MTGPIWENPYGVRVPGSGLRLPGAVPAPRDDHPLVPWKDENHVPQWVDVDHAHKQLESFQSSLTRLEELLDPYFGYGGLVIVSGPPGMGKTTLIHQCIHRAKEYVKGLAPPTGSAPESPHAVPRDIVVMTTGYGNDGSGISIDDEGNFATLSDINDRISHRIVEALRKQFPKSWSDLPTVDGMSLDQVSGRVSDCLTQHDALLLTVIPHIQWLDNDLRTRFLKTCLNRARTRVVLFVEVTHGAGEAAQGVVESLHPNRAVTHLALGALEPEDTLKFSRSARHGQAGLNGALPEAAERITADLMRAHQQGNPADVRELRKVFYATAERKRRERSNWPITSEDLRRHWTTENDPLHGALRRTAPDPPGAP